MEIKYYMGSFAGKAGRFAKTAAKKTGTAASNAKLTIKLRSAMIKLEKMYTTLGKLFYEQTMGIDVRKQIVAEVSKINAQKDMIDELKYLLDEARGKTVCISCGKTISVDAVYCPVCGCKQTLEKIIKKPITKTREEIIDDIISTKPLDINGFVDFFNATSKKYSL